MDLDITKSPMKGESCAYFTQQCGVGASFHDHKSPFVLVRLLLLFLLFSSLLFCAQLRCQPVVGRRNRRGGQVVVTSRAEEEIATNMTAGEMRSWKRLGQTGKYENMRGATQIKYARMSPRIYGLVPGWQDISCTVLDCKGCSRIYSQLVSVRCMIDPGSTA